MLTEAQLKERKNYITASDIAAIIGENPYKTAIDVYLDKISDDIDLSTPSEAAHFGNLLEDVIAEEYARRTGFTVEKEDNLLIHPDYPFLAGTIDRWANNKKHVLEIKTTSFMNKDQWGEEGTDSIPLAYLCQVSIYASICNVDFVDVCVLIGGQIFKQYRYNRDIKLETQLITIAKNFWNHNVQKRIPPLATTPPDIEKLYPISTDNSITINNDILSEIENLRLYKEQLAKIDNQIKESQIKIQNYMQHNSFLLDNDGSVLVTWKSAKPRKAFDSKTFEQENPELYSKYVKEGKAYRTFLIKTKGDKGNE